MKRPQVAAFNPSPFYGTTVSYSTESRLSAGIFFSDVTGLVRPKTALQLFLISAWVASNNHSLQLYLIKARRRKQVLFKTVEMNIRYLPKLLIFSLMLNAVCVTGQESQQSQNRSGVITVDDYSHDRIDRITQETIEEKAHSAEVRSRGHAPADIIPSGWLDDYDYQSDLSSYLSEKYEDALNSSKNTYVYLYSDWYENCRVFRKTVSRNDYAEMFSSNTMILLDYNFFRTKFNFQTRNLPMIVKVNKGGIMGPESINLVSNLNDHPKKAYYKLKKFFEPKEQTG